MPFDLILENTWTIMFALWKYYWETLEPPRRKGLFWELNPGPLAPEARIIPLDQTANEYEHMAIKTRVF